MQDRQALGIQSYGVSVTTMEEVFLRVGQGEEATLEERRQRVKETTKDEVRVGGVEPQYEKLTVRRPDAR